MTEDASGNLTIAKAGSAVITVTAAETATYAQATKDVTVTVNTKTMTVSAEDVTVTVDGQPHGITVNVTDPASGATVKDRLLPGDGGQLHHLHRQCESDSQRQAETDYNHV